MTNIVMTVHNRYLLTEQAIWSLYHNTNGSEFNLTIVDDESEDFRLRRLLDLDRKGTFHFLNTNNTTVLRVTHSDHILGRLKNLGVYWSEQRFGKGDWLYLSDNDVYFTKEWLTILLDAAQSSELEGFRVWGGQAHPYHQPVPGVSLAVPFSTGYRLFEHDCLAGTSMLMRWATWEEHGPLVADAPGVCQSEDFALTEKIRKCNMCAGSGGRIGVVSPNVVIDCGITNSDGKPSPGADLKQKKEGVYYE